MTLNEVATQAPGMALGRDRSTWVSLGEDCWITVLGKTLPQGGAMVVASMIYHEPSETVMALELFGPPNRLWIDSDFQEQFVEEIQQRGLSVPEVTTDWVTQLADLGTAVKMLTQGESNDESRTAIPETDQ